MFGYVLIFASPSLSMQQSTRLFVSLHEILRRADCKRLTLPIVAANQGSGCGVNLLALIGWDREARLHGCCGSHLLS